MINETKLATEIKKKLASRVVDVSIIAVAGAGILIVAATILGKLDPIKAINDHVDLGVIDQRLKESFYTQYMDVN